jgi:2-dehydropantoate 2-reductase
MRILVVGAGATGGYFGGRLLEAGRDVTFLVRPARAAQLAERGLTIRSPHGDYHAPAPPAVIAPQLREYFDLILLSCKAYDLDSAIEAFAPAVGPQSAILPVLNGLRHLDVLDERFSAERVLGGRVLIAATLNTAREIVQLNDVHDIAFGERNRASSERVEAIGREFANARCDHRVSANILHDLWEKWAFLSTLAASTCLCRASIGDICAAPGGRELILKMFDEAGALSAAAGYPPRPPFIKRSLGMLMAEGSTLTASMLRDLEGGAPVEAGHILGDLVRRGPAPFLSIAYTALNATELRRARS